VEGHVHAAAPAIVRRVEESADHGEVDLATTIYNVKAVLLGLGFSLDVVPRLLFETQRCPSACPGSGVALPSEAPG